jgi:magnesium-transporting ATPase (P-type)
LPHCSEPGLVSKEASDLVLTDDNFAAVAQAVREGRRVVDRLVYTCPHPTTP